MRSSWLAIRLRRPHRNGFPAWRIRVIVPRNAQRYGLLPRSVRPVSDVNIAQSRSFAAVVGRAMPLSRAGHIFPSSRSSHTHTGGGVQCWARIMTCSAYGYLQPGGGGESSSSPEASGDLLCASSAICIRLQFAWHGFPPINARPKSFSRNGAQLKNATVALFVRIKVRNKLQLRKLFVRILPACRWRCRSARPASSASNATSR